MPPFGPELPPWDVTGTNTRPRSRTRDTKSATKETVFDRSRTIGRQDSCQTEIRMQGKKLLKNLHGQREGRAAKRRGFASDCGSTIHHRYGHFSHARHGENKCVRRKSSIENERSYGVCVWVGRERFSVRARSGVGWEVSSSNWIIWQHYKRQMFLHGVITVWPRERRTRGERKEEAKGAEERRRSSRPQEQASETYSK